MDQPNQKKIFAFGFLAGLGVAALAGLLMLSSGLVGRIPVLATTDSGSLPAPSVSSVQPLPAPPVAPSTSGVSFEASLPPASAPPQVTTPTPPIAPAQREVIGEFGTLRDSELINQLADEHLELVYRYFDRYYRSISTLKAESLLPYFAPRTDEEYENTLLNQISLQMLCGMRAVRENDLRLKRYQYGIRITAIEEKSPDCIQVDLVEDSEVYFSFLENAQSSNTSGVQHRFVLVKDSAGLWAIASHHSNEDSFLRVWDKYVSLRGSEVLTDQGRARTIFYGLYDQVLATAELEEQKRVSQQASARVDARLPANQYTWKHEYDRDLAVSYSYIWLDSVKTLRNGNWQIYDQNGTNYVSQALYAGGIPMDCTGAHQWKWAGDALNTSQMMIGRSTAWTDVEAFYQYARSNERGGAVALTDGNLYSTRVGDALQLGLLDGWYQTVLIVEVIAESDGTPLDLLINTNTTDRIDYPVSALLTTDLRAIRILGFN